MPERILVVDDDLDTLKLVGLILQRQGYQIVAASGGHQALAKAAAERPDVILLDVMMPDMDGYEVARRLRADPALAHTPIIMFTAKALLDDKVAGFEAGADDYLTKPTHPAELVAHVKALLARTASFRIEAPAEHARIIGFLGAKGGVGTTTVAVNVAAAAAQAGQETILADLRPGSGAAGLMLGLPPGNGLAALAAKPVGDITPRAVHGQLLSHSCGIRVLQAAASPKEAPLADNSAQLQAIVRILSGLCGLLLLDLGSGLPDSVRRLLSACDHLVVVTDQTRVALVQTKALLDDLAAFGLPAAKVDVVAVNRAPASNQLSWSTAEQIVGQKVSAVISPAAELAYQASDVGTPILVLRPDALVADQYTGLAGLLLERVGSASP